MALTRFSACVFGSRIPPSHLIIINSYFIIYLMAPILRSRRTSPRLNTLVVNCNSKYTPIDFRNVRTIRKVTKPTTTVEPVHAPVQSEQQLPSISILPSIFNLSTITPILPSEPILPFTVPSIPIIPTITPILPITIPSIPIIPTIPLPPLPPTNVFQQLPLTIIQNDATADIIPNPFLQYTYSTNSYKQLCCYSPKRIRFDTTSIIIPHPLPNFITNVNPTGLAKRCKRFLVTYKNHITSFSYGEKLHITRENAYYEAVHFLKQIFHYKESILDTSIGIRSNLNQNDLHLIIDDSLLDNIDHDLFNDPLPSTTTINTNNLGSLSPLIIYDPNDYDFGYDHNTTTSSITFDTSEHFTVNFDSDNEDDFLPIEI
jgi:hypothetical protein